MLSHHAVASVHDCAGLGLDLTSGPVGIDALCELGRLDAILPPTLILGSIRRALAESQLSATKLPLREVCQPRRSAPTEPAERPSPCRRTALALTPATRMAGHGTKGTNYSADNRVSSFAAIQNWTAYFRERETQRYYCYLRNRQMDKPYSQGSATPHLAQL